MNPISTLLIGDDGRSFDEVWMRFTPHEVIQHALDATKPMMGSTGLAQQLSNCDGLESCRAVVVCELDGKYPIFHTPFLVLN